ncbi:nephrin-like [Pecten maximus]|uniref:nephrin-like n=1 Tax=Pecten maximus TaxID=6579 RepID=UPI001458B658|nr:nephrin-like [Pecten maximus]
MCVTGSCRPPARIDWYKDSVNVTTQTGSVSSDGDKFVTASSLTLTGAKGDSPATVQCRASNVDGMNPVQSGVKTFVVQWPPDEPPVISGYTSGSILYVNETLSLSCRQQGGNPLSTLTWTGLCVGIPATDGSTVTESVSTITVTVTKGYNKGTCVCVSTHPQPQTQDRSQVTFTVHYPPSGPVIILTPTRPWLEGESGTLSCSYTEGFPAPARIEWFRNGLQTGQSTPSISLSPLTKADNRDGYSCRVRNDFTDIKLTNLTSSVKYLNVEYKPLVTLYPTHLTVVERQTAQLTCDTEGNPAPTVEWLRGGTSVQTGQGASLSLTLSDIDRSATANYTCRAEGVSSVQGRQLITKRIVYLLVQYPPDIVIVAPPNVEEGDTNIRLICRTVGEPNTLTSQSWTQTIGQILIADQYTYTTTTPNTVVFAEVSLYDTGTYTCSVSNGIADRQGQTLQSNSAVLNVKVAPRFNSSGQNHNFYSRLHEQVTIKIPFYSNPPVTSTDDIEWTKLPFGVRIVPSLNITFGLTKDSIDLSMKRRTITFPGQAAVMTLLSFDQSVAGDYTVTVYNDGRRRNSTTVFSINPSAPPETPSHFHEIETTTSSITVQWTKGFNGGHPQTFVILYRPEGGTRTETVSVIEQQQSTYTKDITGLTPNTRYQFNMYAYNEEGNSSLSSVVDTTMKLYTASTPNTASITLFVIAALLFTLTASMFMVCFIYRRKILRKKTSKDRDHGTKPGVNLSRPAEQHGNLNEGSHYDDLNLEEREPPSSYEYLGSSTIVNGNTQDSTDGRQMYESLSTRTNAAVYEQLKGVLR